MINMYYQKHKERLQKEASERYQNLSAEEKDKSRTKARERHHNFTKKKEQRRHCYEERKQKLPDYGSNHYITNKN